jgi:hypothetical protein
MHKNEKVLTGELVPRQDLKQVASTYKTESAAIFSQYSGRQNEWLLGE